MADVVVPGSPVIVPSPGVNAANGTPSTSNLSRNLATLGSSPAQQRLKRAAARAAAFNPEDAAADATGITLTMETSADAALTRVYGVVAPGSPTALNGTLMQQVCRFSGGRFTLDTNQRPVFPVANVAPAVNGNNASQLPATPGYNSWGWEVEFATEATKVQLRMVGFTTHAVRVLVDQGNGFRYVSKTALAFPANGSGNYLTLAFADQRARAIRIEGMQNDQPMNITVAPTATVSRSSGPLDRVIALMTGDSYSEGTGATLPGLLAWTKVLGRRLGWSDTRQVAVGSTGYLSDNGGLRKTIRQQVADWPIVNNDISMADVDVVVVAGGYNDASQANMATLLQPEVVAALQAVRAMCPNALVIVMGPHSGRRGPDATTLQVETLVRAGYDQWADSRSLYIANAGDLVPFTNGTGATTAPAGTGNADTTIVGDGHPSDFGHSWIAQRALSPIRAFLSAIG